MAKKKGSNIQRKNIQTKTSIIHPSVGNYKKETETKQTEHVNSYTFSTIGMFAGLIIGYLFNEINWGFGIGLFTGALIDFIINFRKKKNFEEKFNRTLENSTD
ncbi:MULTISPECIES: hypothetical protein [unclassified Jeotgalibaca]|uniref:hypothetical protein n=1 Tax=unclassified Jeotgalibaca TaxID=2621505 RepID=UPI003FD57B98